MSQKTKASLKTGLNDNYPDNTTGDITPLATRTQNTDQIDSALNLQETTEQTVIGSVDYTGGLKKNGVEVVGTPTDNYSGGLFDYNDLTTTGTPLVITGGGAAVELTNDEAGSFTNKLFPPAGVTDVWDSIGGVFDWSDLKLGDMVDIRIDVDVITASVNTEIKIDLHLGTGGSSYTIPWILETNYKNTGTHKLNRYNGIYMGDTNTLDNGGVFKISSDKNCTVVVNGWYCKIIKRG